MGRVYKLRIITVFICDMLEDVGIPIKASISWYFAVLVLLVEVGSICSEKVEAACMCNSKPSSGLFEQWSERSAFW